MLRRTSVNNVVEALELLGLGNIDSRSCFNLCLKNSFKNLDYLERLTGLILLYRQADLAGNLEVTELLRSDLDKVLDFFLARRLDTTQAMDYYSLMVEEIMFGARGVGKGELGLRAGIESEVQNPIVPIGLYEHKGKGMHYDLSS